MASICLDILHLLDITNVLPKWPLLSPLCVGWCLAMPLGGSFAYYVKRLPNLCGCITSQVYCPSGWRISRLALLQGQLDGQKREVDGTHSTICAFPYQLKGRRERHICYRCHTQVHNMVVVSNAFNVILYGLWIYCFHCTVLILPQ